MFKRKNSGGFILFLPAIMVVSLFVVCFGAVVAKAQSSQGSIAVVVNEEAITVSDIEDRLRLIVVSSGMSDNEETRSKLRPQIINVLIDEHLRRQEAASMEIVIPDQEVELGFASLAEQNKMTADKFRQVLRSGRIPVKTMYDQIRAQIAWTMVVQNKLKPMVEISDNDVDMAMERDIANVGKTEYLVSEIFLSVDSPKDEPEVRKLVNRLRRELGNKAPFHKIAKQFSQTAGALKGGNIGWIQGGQLAQELDEVLVNMSEGGLSQPIRSLSGFHILRLRKKRMITEENLLPREEVYNRIGLRRLERLQHSYLLDLKGAAFIEKRI